MKYGNTLAICLATLLLISCGKADVQSACYSNGDHENMSDGKITRICSCISDRISAQKFSEKETTWVITLLKKKTIKDVPDSEQERLKEVSGTFWGIKRGCEALK
jgi:hypothetical protein